MYILGISCFYHDASAALLKDGEIVAAAEEERFTRKKHDTSFPINAIKYCLESQNITIDKISYISFYEKPFLKFERVLFQHLQTFPMSIKLFLSSTPSWINEKLRLPALIRKQLKYRGDILFVNHHMAHAASAFLVSPFFEAAIVTIDGVGEWTTTAYGVGKNADITLLKEIKFPHSLGLLYSAITAYLGFSVNNSEYKVMGLAPYGNTNQKTNKYYAYLKKIVDVKEDGSFVLDMSYFRYHFSDRMPSKKLCRLLEGPIRKKDSAIDTRHKDIAAALQMLTEEILIKILRHARKETNLDNLVMSGGVALNSVFNGKILKNTKFKKIWIQPAPGDAGSCIGASVYAYNTILGHKRNYVMKNTYLGPEFKNSEIKGFLDVNKVVYTRVKDKNRLIEIVSDLILNNKVIGWFQGRMEFGPRALGSRSILSNATNPEMQNILNLKVKHRENFRPFAPVVCSDDAKKYFECDFPLPDPAEFMLLVYPIKRKFRDMLPAVTHVDGSGRLQAIKKEQNPLYYKLIKRIGEKSGMPVLINTSFNIRGEPIVCTPYDAYKCMMGTGIDYLILGEFIVKRIDNLRDSWNSEQCAKD